MPFILFLLALWFFVASMNCVRHSIASFFAGFTVPAIITALGAAFWGWAAYACMKTARDY